MRGRWWSWGIAEVKCAVVSIQMVVGPVEPVGERRESVGKAVGHA